LTEPALDRGAPLGAILAGGESARYGSPKALATVGGRRIVDRVLHALVSVETEPVLLANEAELFEDLGLPVRPDIRPDLGALGGLHTALHWARESGRPGILAVACDMPFLEPALLSTLLDRGLGRHRRPVPNPGNGARPGGGRPGADVVLPESRSRRGVEPLCAYYGTGCLGAIEAQVERHDHRLIGFHEDVRVATIALPDVERLGDPDILFMNVNTPEDRERAEVIAATR